MFSTTARQREYRRNNPEKYKQYYARYYAKHPYRVNAHVARAVREWRLRNPEKTKAHRAVFVALRAGRLVRQVCFCGEVKVQAHHDDYSKPLRVVWLCRKHHIEADVTRRARM